ncbi:MAG: hypothetical protein HQ509_00095 [Candidatus Marinimicrobia bacterium]|nr:hypothetical protein [Candidatus Neomarinimicrobiota bacterium]
MKTIIKGLVITSLFASMAFGGILSFGLNMYQEMVSVDGYTQTMANDFTTVELTREGFDGAYGIGGYLSLDIIPIVDIEADFSIAGNTYAFNFLNYLNTDLNDAAFETGDIDFAWFHASTYVTVRKKVFGLGIPFIGGGKIHVGAGMNFHSSIPYASIEMMEELLGDDLYGGFEAGAMEDKIVTYMEDNLTSSSGFHIMAGLQFKLLFIDSWLYYRHTIAKDVYADQDSFGSLNLRLGIGF